MTSIVLVSNIFNHHERFFCDEIAKLPDVEFTFIQTVPMDTERKQLGWGIDISKFPYVKCSYGDEKAYETALETCNNADIVIIGSAPYAFIADRVRYNRITFFYAERLFRKGIWHMLNPRTFFTVLKRFIIPGRKSNFYLLAASAYTAIDTAKIFAFNQGRFKWGHFIDVGYPTSRRPHQDSEPIRLLWAGRFLSLKHPDYAVKAAKSLKNSGYNVRLDIIGGGVLEQSLKKLIADYDLGSTVTMHGTMTPEEVRGYMEAADIYMFTSDFNEGWGAVLGEAMTSGCAVVTSHGIGATPFLVQHRHNGLIYKTGDYPSFERCVQALAADKDLRDRLSAKAIETMTSKWNAATAAQRFYELCKSLITTGKPIYFDDGPISKADLLNNNWFNDDKI